MAEICVKIPEELKEQIDESNIDLSRIVVESITNELIKIIALKTLSSKSSLSEKDALELGRKIKAGRFNELKERGLL